MASPARFERATFRLGGGCSIQLSYGDIYSDNFLILTKNFHSVKKIQHLFHRHPHIIAQCPKRKGGTPMYKDSEGFEDLDDLIFDRNDGGPSER